MKRRRTSESCAGYIDNGPVLAAIVLLVGFMVVHAYWGAIPLWAKIAAGVAGAVVFAVGFLGSSGRWPSLVLPDATEADHGKEGTESDEEAE